MNNQNKNLTRSIKIALLAAIAVILMYFELPMTPFPWLKIDLSEVPALMGGFAFGPLAAIVIIVMKNVLHVLIKGTESGFVGQLANIIIGLTLVLPPTIMYSKNKTKKTAIIGLIIGFFSIQLGGIIANKFLLIPLYGGEAILGTTFWYYVLFGLVPINAVKSIASSVLTYALYKKLSVALFKVEPMKEVKKNKQVA